MSECRTTTGPSGSQERSPMHSSSASQLAPKYSGKRSRWASSRRSASLVWIPVGMSASHAGASGMAESSNWNGNIDPTMGRAAQWARSDRPQSRVHDPGPGTLHLPPRGEPQLPATATDRLARSLGRSRVEGRAQRELAQRFAPAGELQAQRGLVPAIGQRVRRELQDALVVRRGRLALAELPAGLRAQAPRAEVRRLEREGAVQVGQRRARIVAAREPGPRPQLESLGARRVERERALGTLCDLVPCPALDRRARALDLEPRTGDADPRHAPGD